MVGDGKYVWIHKQRYTGVKISSWSGNVNPHASAEQSLDLTNDEAWNLLVDLAHHLGVEPEIVQIINPKFTERQCLRPWRGEVDGNTDCSCGKHCPACGDVVYPAEQNIHFIYVEGRFLWRCPRRLHSKIIK